MAITVQSVLDILSDIQAYIKARLPNISISLDTVEGIRNQAIALALNGLQVFAKAIEDDIFPQTAAADALEKHAEVRGLERKGATTSSGTDALRVYGTSGATVSAGETLVHTDGTRYQLSEDGTIPAGGSVDLTVESISTGTATNKAAAETLTFETPPSGITAEAVLQSALTGAVDEETDDGLRARLLDAFQNPPGGGKFSDYRQWAEAIEGVASAYCYGPSSADADGRRGLGVVDVAILKSGSGSDRIPTSTLEGEVQEALDLLRPACVKELDILVPGTDEEDIDIQITPEVGYEFDWTETAHQVSSWDAGNKRITWNTAIPATLQAAVDAGDPSRIYMNGEVLTVTAYGAGGGNDTDIAEEPTTKTPVATDPIYAAGPLSQPCLTAVLALFDSLGPARGTAADPEQEWEDTLRVSELIHACMSVTGVKDVTVNTPAANVTPTDHGVGGTVDLIVPNLDRVQIRKA